MRYTRMAPLIVALVLALAPATTHAASSASASLEKQRANVANDIARCQLAAAGKHLPGKVAPSQPAAAAACGGAARALATLPGAPPKCPLTGRGLNKLEMNEINEFEIALAKAQKKNRPLPVPSADVLALTAC